MKIYVIVSSTELGYAHIEGIYQNKELGIEAINKLIEATENSLAKRKLLVHQGKFLSIQENLKSHVVSCYSNRRCTVELIAYDLNRNYDGIIHFSKPGDFDSLYVNPTEQNR